MEPIETGDQYSGLHCFLVNHELVQQKRRVNDLEADMESLRKQLRLAQTRMTEQVSEFSIFESSLLDCSC